MLNVCKYAVKQNLQLSLFNSFCNIILMFLNFYLKLTAETNYCYVIKFWMKKKVLHQINKL